MAKPNESDEQQVESIQENALVTFTKLCGRFREPQSGGSVLPDEISVSFIISWDEKEYESSTRPGTPIPGYVFEGGVATHTDTDKNKNLMRLKYYLIVNSMKHVYPASGKVVPVQKSSVTRVEAELLERNPRYVFMMSEMQNKRELVKELVGRAATYCRRDMLWDKLLQYEGDSITASKKIKKKDETVTAELAISFAEFNVLLESTIRVPLTSTDKSLIALLDNNRPWYENLLQSLRTKFNVLARYFKSEDGMIHQLGLLNQSYQSMLVLLTVDFQANIVELEAVYRAQQDLEAATQDSQTQQDISCQKHVETVINAICFHLWTSIQ